MARSKIGKSRRTRTTSSGASVLMASPLKIAREARVQRLPRGRAGRLVRDLREHVVGEGVHEEVAGLERSEATGAQVEQRRLVESADRGAVRASNVVRVDLELGARVDDRAVREDEVLVRLLRVRLLRVLPHDDPAVEDGAR